MYIVQIADLHIGSSVKTSKSEKDIINDVITKIKEYIPLNSKVLLFVGGDIIDSALVNDKPVEEKEVIERYKEAGELLDLFNKELRDSYDLVYKFCFGNHDITHQNEFYECVKRFDDSITKEELLNCYSYEDGEATFIIANSCYENGYEKGGIHFENLKTCLDNNISNNCILLFHHTIISMDETDASSIIDTEQLLRLINQYKVKAVFHGHIHGRSEISIGDNNCKIIGTGALFSRNHGDVNSQFNIAEYKNGIFLQLLNFRYNADVHDWISEDILKAVNNHFYGQTFSEVYSQLCQKLSAKDTLYNVVLNINNSYEKFQNDLKKYVINDEIKIGSRMFSYGELAEMWEADSVPDELYFNHGSFFYRSGKKGYEFIADILKGNNTSSRAVLTTYGMKDIEDSLKDETKYLPSLEHIQFSYGLRRKTLYVHMHLRALEASRFLNINICEIGYLLDKLIEKQLVISQVDISISAFRVQIKEGFNCFIKPKIDRISEQEISFAVYANERGEICDWLLEKSMCTETITDNYGMYSLYKSFMFIHEKKKIYDASILNLMKSIIAQYEELDKIHQRTSIHSEEKACEQKIKKLIDGLIIELKRETDNE